MRASARARCSSTARSDALEGGRLQGSLPPLSSFRYHAGVGNASDDLPIPSIRYLEDDEEEGKETTIGTLGTLGAPRATRSRPSLIGVGGFKSVGRIFRVSDGMTIGRSLNCDIVLTEEGVSRRHAKIRLDGSGAVRIEDLGSRNGLIHRGRRVTAVAMSDGDRVQIGDAALALLQMEDVDDTLRQNMLVSATEDPDTKLLVRRRFLELLSREFTFARRYHVPMSIALFSLDSYKKIVDQHGAAAGAYALRAVGTIIQGLAQREDVVLARYAEDMIGVMLPETGSGDCRTFAELTRRAVETAHIAYLDAVLPATVSGGFATTSHPACADVGALVEWAERGTHRAKLAGHNAIRSGDEA